MGSHSVTWHPTQVSTHRLNLRVRLTVITTSIYGHWLFIYWRGESIRQSKLCSYDTHTDVVEWITCFLTKRRHRVQINDYFSSSATVLSGIPQGSVLGPLLCIPSSLTGPPNRQVGNIVLESNIHLLNVFYAHCMNRLWYHRHIMPY